MAHASKIRKAVIPVAGFGTRFLPFTKAMPKEMLPIVDKPVIQYIVEEAVAAGVEQIILVTGSTKRAIEDHFDSYFELEYKLEQGGKEKELKEIRGITQLAQFIYVRQKEAKGLGDAILTAEPAIDNEPFAILYGDDVIDAQKPVLKQMLEVYTDESAPMIGVTEVSKETVSRYGAIDPKPIGNRLYRIKKIIEKPSIEEAPSQLVITGRVILPPKIFSILKQTKPGKGGEIQLTDALTTLIAGNSGYAYHYEGTFYDCGNKLEYLKAVVNYALKHEDLKEEFVSYLKSINNH
jgi:UTP--glucose-1-phosphate uridylyltransferase